MCILCRHQRATKDNKPSNIIQHIKQSHEEVLPYEFLSSGFKNKMEAKWKKAISIRDSKITTSSSSVQINKNKTTTFKTILRNMTRTKLLDAFSRAIQRIGNLVETLKRVVNSKK